MRARIILTGFVTIVAAACSRPAADPVVDPASDEPSSAPDLALRSPEGVVPVASDLEMNLPEPAPLPEQRVPTPEPANVPEPTPEPIGSAPASSAAMEPVQVATSHVHPKAADEPAEAVDAVSEPANGPSAEGGGKPTGVSTGLGPVPDRTWGDPVIMDDPNPLPGPYDGAGVAGGGVIGRGGVIIIRGGMGGLDDDCAIHPRGGIMAGGGMTGGGMSGPGVLVNDRGPRQGASINERAPRTSSRPSFPRGGGFPRGGIR